MAWIGKSQGVFNLHESDRFCGSFLSLADAAEILDVGESQLSAYAKDDDEGHPWVSELDLHKRWGSGDIPSPYPSKVGSATRSFDELILERLIRLTFPDATIDIQVPFGRKRMDLAVTHCGGSKGIEFLGPSHFIQQYQRELKSPFDRKKEAEDVLGYECVLWPYWIQRCTSNVKAIFDQEARGFASVWSTKAHFGDFQLFDSAQIIYDITARFHALQDDGIGYMYMSEHTEKPEHPIISQILKGKSRVERLIPRDNRFENDFWIPRIITDGANNRLEATGAPPSPQP